MLSTLEQQIASITSDSDVQRRLAARGLQAYSITWEDTGRSKNSVWGPNISDMTLRVGENLDMPVIRRPNFSDVTVDVPLDKVRLTVGNERDGLPLRRILLREYLENAAEYTNNPRVHSLYSAERDSVVLTSAQACVLPLRDGSVSFHVSLYNYQSVQPDNPAVLVIIGTAQGTSAQVVDRNSNALYFNDKGTAVELVAKRLEDDRRDRGVAANPGMPMTTEERDRNMIYLIQVPLKNRQVYMPVFMSGGPPESLQAAKLPKAKERSKSKKGSARGYDHAIIQKGTESKGEFRGTRGLLLERDERFPIRLTVQFYAVTDMATVPETIVDDFARRIEQIYSRGLNESSLVTEGNTSRPTEHYCSVCRTNPPTFRCNSCSKVYCRKCLPPPPPNDPLMFSE